jgi:hypothetical protein
MAYEQLWRNKWLTAKAASIGEMADLLQAAAEELRAMAARGVRLDGGQADDHARLVTDDPTVAKEFGFDEEEPEDEGRDEDPEEILPGPARGGQVLGGCVSGYTAGPRAAWQNPENGANT